MVREEYHSYEGDDEKFLEALKLAMNKDDNNCACDEKSSQNNRRIFHLKMLDDLKEIAKKMKAEQEELTTQLARLRGGIYALAGQYDDVEF